MLFRFSLFRMPRYILTAGLFLVSATSFASDCQASSPNVQMHGDAWKPIPEQTVSKVQMDELFNFLDSIKGRWRGDGVMTECYSRGGKIIPRPSPQSIEVTIAQGSATEYRFQSKLYDTKRKIRTAQAFTLARKDRVIEQKGEGDIEITSLNKNHIRYRTQTLLVQNLTGSRYVRVSLEMVRNISLRGGRLSISVATFHNGTMLDFSDWVFVADT